MRSRPPIASRVPFASAIVARTPARAAHLARRITILLALATAGFGSAATAVARPAPGPAPAFTLPARGGTISLAGLRGKVVLVDFWASWCEPCRKSFPWMAQMNERYASKGLAIVAIDLDKSRAAADAFLAEHPAPFEVAFDPAGEVAEAYRVRAMPTSFLVAPDGTVLRSHAGFDPRSAQTLEALIHEACAR